MVYITCILFDFYDTYMDPMSIDLRDVAPRTIPDHSPSPVPSHERHGGRNVVAAPEVSTGRIRPQKNTT